MLVYNIYIIHDQVLSRPVYIIETDQKSEKQSFVSFSFIKKF